MCKPSQAPFTGGLFSCILYSLIDSQMQLRPYQDRVCTSMQINHLGQLILPTGAGKTFCMIKDAMRQFDCFPSNYTIVVVAPRILLAEQLSSEFLEFITNTRVMHVHSGETHHFSSTKPEKIRQWYYHHPMSRRMIFTTYNSLQRVIESGIKVDTIYFDEAHNSVKRNFFPDAEHFSQEAGRCYFFTATPKHSVTISKPGMNDELVYGKVLEQVKAEELIEHGAIIPPKVQVAELPEVIGGDVAQRDCANLLNVMDNSECMERVLITAAKTKHIAAVMSETDFQNQCNMRGYSVMWITSKHGAFIDGTKVNREVFFDTLNEWGKDSDKKFVVLHHSILAEGINVSGLTACVLMRNMDYIEMAQTIGRVIRLDSRDRARISSGDLVAGDVKSYVKSFGLVHIPVYSKVGITTAKRVQNVVDTIFNDGEPAISVVRR